MAHFPLRYATPVGAPAAPAPRPTLARRVWRFLERYGERRAARELARTLVGHADAGGSAAERQAALEAAAVRRMADAYATSDRGFAADLYAAADRHERLAAAPPPAVR